MRAMLFSEAVAAIIASPALNTAELHRD